MYKRHAIGKMGEDIACNYLIDKNYNVVERNFKCNQGEIDVIAWDKEKKELVFIEIKTRTNYEYGMPIDAVDTNKQRHILNTAKYYIYKNKIKNTFIRFDVIEVCINQDKYIINQIKQVL
ncbi:MAG: YraN family protein [Clostridia bacterium]|nr:YraN family protein [Clostridia bacterium]